MANKPKVFIIGISGLIGYSLGRRLRKNFLVSGASFRSQVLIPNTQIFPITLKNLDVLEAVIRMQQPDIVISAVGVNDRKEAEEQPKISDMINVSLPVSMAILTSRLKAKFIYLSCAEVFDGINGNYSEEDNDFTLSDPVGKQKITAHSYIRAQTLESTILRVGRVVGIGTATRASFFDRIRVCASKKAPYEASKNKSRSYISNISLADAVNEILMGEIPSKHRIFHVGGANITEFEMVQEWYNLMKLDPKLVTVLEGDAKRDLSLNCALMMTQFPKWKQESKQQLFLNVLQQLCPGEGATKWQKTLQTL